MQHMEITGPIIDKRTGAVNKNVRAYDKAEKNFYIRRDPAART